MIKSCCNLFFYRDWTVYYFKYHRSLSSVLFSSVLILKVEFNSSKLSELNWELLSMDSHNPYRLIPISTVGTYNCYEESAWYLDLWYPNFLYFLIGWELNSLASDWLFRFPKTTLISGFPIKIELICRSAKDPDQALISISTVKSSQLSVWKYLGCINCSSFL